MYTEKYIIQSFGDLSSADYLKEVPVEYLRKLNIPETDIEAAAKITEWNKVKLKRTALLAESDWVVTKAMDTGTTVSNDWQEYRQALRDITTQSNPFNITWPTKP